jgi:ATP-dependent DNA helicase RecG
MIDIFTPLSAISSIRQTMLAKLKRLDISTIHDLFFHLPTRYEDYSALHSINTLTTDERCTILGTVVSINTGRTSKRRLFLAEAIIDDGTGRIRAIWFNQRFIAQMLTEGMEVRLSGKVSRDSKGLAMQNPAVERSSRDATHTGRLIPIYPETAGLTSKFFRWQIAALFSVIEDFHDPIPKEILSKLHLPSLKTALYYIHFPKNETESLLARKRFAFDEMLLLQLRSLQVKALFDAAHSKPLVTDKDLLEGFIGSFPFHLTDAQRKASEEILADLSQPHPMNRLLNGDVGSGKTAVAALAAFIAANNGTQTAILAPTEILARQHFENLSKLFANTTHGVALFTSSYHMLGGDTVTRPTLLKAIKAGIPQIIVGTHALLQDDVAFHDLALIVVDEQHRFGVAQRAKLQNMTLISSDTTPDTVPHFLTMTATPIPRTLTLAFFGNLDLSILDEMPKNRKSIITRLATTEADRAKAYAFIRNEIEKGRQAFVIFPLVEESTAMKEVRAATAEKDRLAKEIFPDCSIGLLHGKLKAQEKETVMREFRDGKYDILVATAVVEVGIDIPNASVIMIEEAERFGLAQLHQFRGRVGRDEHQSYCLLIPGKHSSGSQRLTVLTQTANGFDIAEADLALRGPGSFLGTRQSGLPDITMEHLANMRLIEITRKEAAAILHADPELTGHLPLRDALKKFEERIHLE